MPTGACAISFSVDASDARLPLHAETMAALEPLRILRRAIVASLPAGPARILWRKASRPLEDYLVHVPRPGLGVKFHIELRAAATHARGAQPLHASYGHVPATRTPNSVRNSPRLGDVFAHLASRRAGTVVEFGAAFGVSGMYFLSGLDRTGAGHLYSFEVNPLWADFARKNLAAVSSRFTLTLGAFETHVDRVVPGPIDLALIDAIHTRDFVAAQFEIVRRRASPGALILIDDLDFPTGDMREGWDTLWRRDDVVGACEVDDHLGIVQLT